VSSNPFGVEVFINGNSIPNWAGAQVGYMGITASGLEKNTDFRFDNYLFVAENCPLPGEGFGAPLVRPPVEMERPALPLP
jgi:hypothetical protein